MKTFQVPTIMTLCCAGLLMAGCGSGSSTATMPDSPDIAVSCIAVMPTDAPELHDASVSESNKKNLRNGTAIMDNLLTQQFTNNPQVRFIGASQISGLDTGEGDALSLARKAGQHLNCNTVLDVSLLRYRERVGSELSSNTPAAVSFSYRLMELDKGQVLCQGSFDEEQNSVLENIFTIGAASRRGFRWISGEDLMREGLQNSLSACKHLQAK